MERLLWHSEVLRPGFRAGGARDLWLLGTVAPVRKGVSRCRKWVFKVVNKGPRLLLPWT